MPWRQLTAWVSYFVPLKYWTWLFSHTKIWFNLCLLIGPLAISGRNKDLICNLTTSTDWKQVQRNKSRNNRDLAVNMLTIKFVHIDICFAFFLRLSVGRRFPCSSGLLHWHRRKIECLLRCLWSNPQRYELIDTDDVKATKVSTRSCMVYLKYTVCKYLDNLKAVTNWNHKSPLSPVTCHYLHDINQINN